MVARRLQGPLTTTIRMWVDGESPDGRHLEAGAIVAEWAGRTGHPTSYGLLGIAPASTASRLPSRCRDRLAESLAEEDDAVRFGLPDEYRPATAEALRVQRGGWEVLVAAHGEIGSSPMAFRRIAEFLLRLSPSGPRGGQPIPPFLSAWEEATAL